MVHPNLQFIYIMSILASIMRTIIQIKNQIKASEKECLTKDTKVCRLTFRFTNSVDPSSDKTRGKRDLRLIPYRMGRLVKGEQNRRTRRPSGQLCTFLCPFLPISTVVVTGLINLISNAWPNWPHDIKLIPFEGGPSACSLLPGTLKLWVTGPNAPH